MVEDEPDIHELICYHWKKMDSRPCRRIGKRALHLSQNRRPDLVLLDLNAPASGMIF